jgi:hypothetical protein
MGVRGASYDQLRQPVSFLREYSRGLVYSLVGVILLAVLKPVAVPAMTLKSSGGVVAIQQLPAVRNGATGAVVLGGYLSDAEHELQSERESIEAETQAFHEFAEAVQSMSTGTQSTPGLNTARVTETGTDRQQLQEVRQQYRKTVLTIPNYENEYGESLEEHLAAEFNADMASVLIEGHQFTQPIQQMLVQQSRQAARRREPLLEALTAEESSLADAKSHLQSTDAIIDKMAPRELPPQPFGELVTIDSDIQQTSRRCERLLAERQRDIHQMNQQFSESSESLLQEYFYKRLDVTFPVLTTTLDRLRQLRERRSDLIRAITRRY